MSSSRVIAAELVDALGVAWTIHGLYPDPENQPAFARATADVAEVAAGDPFSVSVGPGAFVLDGEEFRSERQASERLAVRLFVHRVELLRVGEPPSERDIVRLFDLLAKEPEVVAESGGVAYALARDGVAAFSVVERSVLEDVVGDDELERDEQVVTVMADAIDPAAFAAELMALTGQAVETAGKVIHGRYHHVLDRVAADDIAGHEEVVQAFVEAFFHLPEVAQVSVLEQFLANHHNADDQAFIDQFAGRELASISTRLDTQAMALLMDYANVVTDPEADVRSGELLTLLREIPSAVDSARQVIASHMTQRWGTMVEGSESDDTSVQFAMPDRERYFFTVLNVFRALLEVEDRDDRFGRLMRIWSGKVLASLRKGQLKRAELWLRSVRDHPTFAPERTKAVEAALDSLVGEAMVEHLARYYDILDDPAPIRRILLLSGRRIVDPLITRLADSQEGPDRKTLTELVTLVAAADPESIISRLDDDRWYLVRNLAVALRRCGRLEAAEGLRAILGHDDYRVRVEAVRGISVLEGEASLDAIGVALTDDEDAVRTAAIAALGVHGGPNAEQCLIDVLDSSQLNLEQRRRTIELIGRNPTPEAKDLLTRLANRRFVVTATARLVKDAARRALDLDPQSGGHDE